MPRIKTPVAERFAAKYQPEPNSGCWLWLDALDRDGYGRLQIAGRSHKAHRVSFELHCAPIEDGELVCHRCDNPACVNPAHLFAGSNTDNIADMVKKGRSPRVKNPMVGERNGNAFLTEDQARYVLREVLLNGRRRSCVARELSASKDAIDKLCSGKTWRHLPRAEAALIARYGAGR